MSLVLGYANKEHAIIMSDGRAGENGSFSEYYNKTRKINDNIILGFVGFKEPVEILIEYFLAQQNVSNWSVEDIWEYTQYNLTEKEEMDFFSSTMMIIGKDRNGNMQTSTIGDCTGYQLLVEPANSPRFLCIGGTIDESSRNEILNRNMYEGNGAIIERMKNTIKAMSKVDAFVNANCFYITL